MKTVIEMAREAGFEAKRGYGLRDSAPEDVFAASVNITREIKRFAELVRADEREACAKVCDHIVEGKHPDDIHSDSQWAALSLAAEIRARGNT